MVTQNPFGTKVIANKYPNCTVYFADLAGFTEWAADREPEQVFELLEALYGAFDAVALRRGVFKVETVGDCYMAVTGLPNEQPDHAVRMAKFAMECQQKMEDITGELTVRLGEGTDSLALRTGLHSGEVTAGVLRGEKGRFQVRTLILAIDCIPAKNPCSSFTSVLCSCLGTQSIRQVEWKALAWFGRFKFRNPLRMP
eukprot:Nitzschia sp. Nitz4//scaffold84_size84139//73565//74158//NITZ4_005211-RA/size84139-exonerate_protein2genome-gene-0.76-mRNA-1//-1//CDS//3329559072//3931//frame0